MLPLISVFSHVTQTSFFFAILTNYTLKFQEDFELFTTMNRKKGVYSGKTSKMEFIFQRYMKHVRKDNDLKGSYLTEWPFMLGKEIPDIYDSTLKEFVYYQVRNFVLEISKYSKTRLKGFSPRSREVD